eukprot:7383743-Prymnesium_polylepis.1
MVEERCRVPHEERVVHTKIYPRGVCPSPMCVVVEDEQHTCARAPVALTTASARSDYGCSGHTRRDSFRQRPTWAARRSFRQQLR